MKAKKLIILVSIILFICFAVSVFSILFEVGHSSTCEKEHCSVCQFFNELRKSSGLFLSCITVFFTLAIFAFIANFIHHICAFNSSLVDLKVKLSN